MNTIRTISVSALASVFKGKVIAPDSPEYDVARVVVLGGIDAKPAIIVRVVDVSDVVKCIALASESGLPLAVRSGGHSGAGYSTVDGGIVLDVRDMKKMTVDVEHKTAWAESGLTAKEYSDIAATYNLATGFGDTGSVGISGITLGGGVGYFARTYGLTIDDVLAAEIVTADGHILQVDSTMHPDLFWAIRGGGGNFGVVTKFQYRLHPVSSIMGGMMAFPATEELIVKFVRFASQAPEEFNAICNIMTAPPMPFLPKEYHGKPIILMLLAYIGEGPSATKTISDLKTMATPLADMVRIMKYPELYPPEDPQYHPIASARTMFLDYVDMQVASTMLDRIKKSTATMAAAQLRVLGGAMARVPVDATAFAHRQSHIMVNLAAVYQVVKDKSFHDAWVNEFMGALRQKDQGAYVNFLADEGLDRVKAAYPEKTWSRLCEIKTRYDPENLFCRNQNIVPKLT